MVCFDELPYQLVAETCLPLPLQPGKPRRYDYEYRRNGTCNLFMFFQPLAGWRQVEVTEQHTKRDFACRLKDLVDLHFPQAEVIREVLSWETLRNDQHATVDWHFTTKARSKMQYLYPSQS